MPISVNRNVTSAIAANKQAEDLIKCGGKPTPTRGVSGIAAPAAVNC
ncbi:hypothetical protein [Nostoc sp. CHAB 5715]|nr:hypothetical protein [Nostoc sp. CHAB 5715]MCC5623869.1 hypothetical protein [Nostoc sp. CHAB 5715]